MLWNQMIKGNKHNTQEQILYLTICVIVFLAPLLGILLTNHKGGIDANGWHVLSLTWLKILPFLLIFLLHNYLLLPKYFLQKKFHRYAVYVAIVVIGLCCYKIGFFPSNEDPMNHHPNPPEMEMKKMPPPYMAKHIQPIPQNDKRPPMPEGEPPAPPIDNAIQCVVWSVIALLILGMNIAIKQFFNSQEAEDRMKEIEKEKLKTELQYLRYQINPHFFMNTLNNIHALVDIDKEKAKTSIIELSRLMRYVLYDANHETISLNNEIVFLQNYIKLMRLRFTEKIQIDVSFPSIIPDVQIPPLLFVSFLENAFKHGISYQNESNIKMAISIDDDSKFLLFTCSNPIYGNTTDEAQHGIGLKNVSKRLNLLYGDKSKMIIDNDLENKIFKVSLKIPLS
jgi:hypothetical protein